MPVHWVAKVSEISLQLLVPSCFYLFAPVAISKVPQIEPDLSVKFMCSDELFGHSSCESLLLYFLIHSLSIDLNVYPNNFSFCVPITTLHSAFDLSFGNLQFCSTLLQTSFHLWHVLLQLAEFRLGTGHLPRDYKRCY